MKKLFQNPIVAWAVLILAVVVGLIIGQIKKPAALPKVSYGVWICDDAGILSAETEKTLAEYNRTWDQKYGGAVVAVATVNSIKGWESNTFADTLGKKWGLGEKDMLLLIYPEGNGVNYWVAQGSYLQENQMDTQQNKLKVAIEGEIYSRGPEAGAVALFQQADVYYAQLLGQPIWNQTETESTQWRDRSGVSIFKVILLIIGIIAAWAILDRIRYGRYRRRAAVNPVPAVSYYPIFWGRPTRAAAPHVPTPPAQTGIYHSPNRPANSSGTYQSSTRPPIVKPGQRPTNTQGTRPPVVKPGQHPATPVKPAGKSGGSGKGGFGGGKR